MDRPESGSTGRRGFRERACAPASADGSVLSEFYGSALVEQDTLADGLGQQSVPRGAATSPQLPQTHPGARGTALWTLRQNLPQPGPSVDDGDDDRSHLRPRHGLRAQAHRTVDRPGATGGISGQPPVHGTSIRRRVAALGNVVILDNHDVIEPMIAGNIVSGARIITRDSGIATVLDADVVIDATGRASRSGRISAELRGFRVPLEIRSPSVGVFSGQLMHIPPRTYHRADGLVRPGRRTAQLPAGGLRARDTWMLAITCPDEYGTSQPVSPSMLEASRAAAAPNIMTGLRDATPVGQVSISRSTAATWRAL